MHVCRLTRIRTNFWVFQEKYPDSGSNPACLFPWATHNRTHTGHTGALAAHFPHARTGTLAVRSSLPQLTQAPLSARRIAFQMQ